MAIGFVLLKRLYRVLVPRAVQDSRLVARLKARLLHHDWVYDARYFENLESTAARSARRIAGSIVNDLKVASVVDVGCGTGALLEALRDSGCEVFGLEYSEAALRYCRARQLHVVKFDLESQDFEAPRAFDAAVSMEVAEHLPEAAADRYVDLLTRLSRTVVFTAAPPGQGGSDHVNEQPPSYWIAKFRQRGFEHAEEQSRAWREGWKAAGDVESWYYRNLMIFRSVELDPSARP